MLKYLKNYKILKNDNAQGQNLILIETENYKLILKRLFFQVNM